MEINDDEFRRLIDAASVGSGKAIEALDYWSENLVKKANTPILPSGPRSKLSHKPVERASPLRRGLGLRPLSDSRKLSHKR